MYENCIVEIVLKGIRSEKTEKLILTKGDSRRLAR